MNSRLSIFRILSVVVLASLVLGACAPAQPEVQRPIKVGIVDCYSGRAAVYGEDALNGFKLALEDINEEGVLGTTIEYTTRDTKFEVDTGLAMAKELVMMEEVDVLVGTINSAVALAEKILKLKESGLTVLLAEQNVRSALRLSDFGYIMDDGHIRHQGSVDELRENEEVRKKYLLV